MNKVFIVGNIAKDPLVKTTSTGKTVVNFSVACNDRVQGKEISNFFNCVAWNSQANYIGSYVKKGDTVAIDGKLNKRSYVNKEGKNIFVTEIMVDSIKTIVKRNKTQASEEALVSVNENFSNNVVSQEADFAAPAEAKPASDGLNELEWINEEEGK